MRVVPLEPGSNEVRSLTGGCLSATCASDVMGSYKRHFRIWATHRKQPAGCSPRAQTNHKHDGGEGGSERRLSIEGCAINYQLAA